MREQAGAGNQGPKQGAHSGSDGKGQGILCGGGFGRDSDRPKDLAHAGGRGEHGEDQGRSRRGAVESRPGRGPAPLARGDHRGRRRGLHELRGRLCQGKAPTPASPSWCWTGAPGSRALRRFVQASCGYHCCQKGGCHGSRNRRCERSLAQPGTAGRCEEKHRGCGDCEGCRAAQAMHRRGEEVRPESPGGVPRAEAVAQAWAIQCGPRALRGAENRRRCEAAGSRQGGDRCWHDRRRGGVCVASAQGT
mmetsp:Transcript_62562/g.149137  ORF Transcript_62562/g.149137 Transcript_62562/m.149137 type:complete len:249 (-) Transcript_62562:741-1487(-)